MCLRMFFYFCKVTALFVKQKCTNCQRHLDPNDRTALFQRFFFHDPQYRQRQRARIANAPLTVTAWAKFSRDFFQRWTQTLAAHFH